MPRIGTKQKIEVEITSANPTDHNKRAAAIRLLEDNLRTDVLELLANASKNPANQDKLLKFKSFIR